LRQVSGTLQKKLDEYVKFSSRGNEHILLGISPDSLLSATFSCSSFFNSDIDSGSDPTNLLELISKTVKFFNNAISGDKHPVNPEFDKMTSLRDPAIFVRLVGMQPLKLLFARTNTETGEFPMFFGIDDLNLLLLKNNASSFRSNNSDGILPVKLLYLMSRNLSEGIRRRTGGNGPSNWLLLRSISWSSFKSWRLSGI